MGAVRGEYVAQFSVTAGPAAVLGRAGAVPIHAARRWATGSEYLDVVGPAVAEVVEVLEPGAEVGHRLKG